MEYEDREDLLREATALVERAEFMVEGFDEPVVVGFRRSGALSVYYGSSPVDHFNGLGQWRRGFVDGRLLKAEGGKLVAMRRERRSGATYLVAQELDEEESARCLRAIRQRLDALHAGLAGGRFQVRGSFPPNAKVADRVGRWIAQLPNAIVVAESPRV